MNRYPRETDELLPAPVERNGVIATSGVQYAITADTARPTTWTAPYVVDGVSGVRVTGLAPGVWRVWAKVTGTNESPVIDLGNFTVT